MWANNILLIFVNFASAVTHEIFLLKSPKAENNYNSLK